MAKMGRLGRWTITAFVAVTLGIILIGVGFAVLPGLVSGSSESLNGLLMDQARLERLMPWLGGPAFWVGLFCIGIGMGIAVKTWETFKKKK